MAFFSQLTKKQGLKLRFKALIISLLILGPAFASASVVLYTHDNNVYMRWYNSALANPASPPTTHLGWYCLSSNQPCNGGNAMGLDTHTGYAEIIASSLTNGSTYNAVFADTPSTIQESFTVGSVPAFDTSTRIIDFTPADNSTTTSPVTFTLQGYVNPDDIGTFIGVKFTLHNIDQNVLLLSAFSPNDIYFLSGFNATTSGPFNFSSTTPIADGNYRLEAILERSYLSGWFVNPFSPINQDISHQFVVGTSTFIGTISANGFNEINSIFASSTATTTSAVAQNCNPFVGQFDIIKCGAFLFIPGGDYLNTTMKGLKDGILTRVPWGYLTRIYTIWNTSATTTLPTFNVSFATGPGDNSNMGTSTLSFDPGDMIAGGGTLLESIKDPVNGKSTKDIFGPLVQLAFALGVIFMIISDLTGSHRHNEEVAKATKLS